MRDTFRGIMDGTYSLMKDGLELIRGAKLSEKKNYFGKVGTAFTKFKEKINAVTIPSGLVDEDKVPLTKPDTFGRKIEDAIGVPTNLLDAVDGFVFQVLKTGFDEAINPAYKKAIKDNIEAMSDLDQEIIDKTIREILRGEMTEKGLGVLNDFFGTLGSALYTTRRADNEIVRFISMTIIPFIKVPINWIRQGLEATPFGGLNLIGSKDKMDVLSKAMLGSVIGVWGANMYAQGKLTGGYPQDISIVTGKQIGRAHV